MRARADNSDHSVFLKTANSTVSKIYDPLCWGQALILRFGREAQQMFRHTTKKAEDESTRKTKLILQQLSGQTRQLEVQLI